jgi:hypothetical protein
MFERSLGGVLDRTSNDVLVNEDPPESISA